MAGIRIHIEGLNQANEALKTAVRNGADEGLKASGIEAARLVTDNITHSFFGRPPAVATGILANSITFQISRETGVSRAIVFASPPADQYAAYVEAGTGPHFPPPRALLLWVKKKFATSSEKQALSIAFAIARTIARRGTTAFGMFARAFQVLDGELQGIFEAAIARALRAAGFGAK